MSASSQEGTKAMLAEFVIEDEAWGTLEDGVELCQSVLAHAAQLIKDYREGMAAVMLTNDGVMQDLNARFRDKDKPTNVLSFPAPEGEDYPGDIALGFETCAREAEEKGISLRNHVIHLVVHGFLHLNGFDHQDEDEAQDMESLETRILAHFEIDDPYQSA
ncbi:rRNA maturation RNase YbeY [Woodsholea maritima]|uniref:rRNA maturation RNase YbeY n=1 Tax=Woodsholea maritima TaxID=240237 RepID=UPI001F17FA0D|nr:rRNA maturation RNase YbeY [Woodsholea maritima]